MQTSSTLTDSGFQRDGSTRLELIDALRGFALAGVLLGNLNPLSLYYYLDDAARAALPTAELDAWGRIVVQSVVDGKAITLFSLLFGLGFAIQLERAEARGAGLAPYVRRIAVLLGFGAIHAYLLWWGDILLLYALLAFLMIPMRHASDRALLVGGLGLGLLGFLLAPLMESWMPANAGSKEQMHAMTLAAFSSGSVSATVTQNITFAQWIWADIWGLVAFVYARFLLGYWAGRKRLLHDPEAHRPLLRRLLVVGGLAGLVATAALHGIGLADLGDALTSSGAGAFVLDLLRRIGPLGLGIAYAAGFALMFMRPRWQSGLRLLAPVGRMALTNYLVQTVVCVWLFYGIGLGIGPRYGYAACFAIWALLFGAQIASSHWWLARFQFGPAEWLWRSLTYLRWQPLRVQGWRRRHEVAP